MAEPHCLYFWDMELVKGVVGHIALKVAGPKKDDDFYISHWPKDSDFIYFKSVKKGQKDQESLFYDIKLEGNRKPQVFHIPFDSLDPAKIIQWKTETEKNYHLLKWNCADVVRNALQIGMTDPELRNNLKHSFLKRKAVMVPLAPGSLFSWVKNEFTEQNDESVREQRPLSVSDPSPLYPCAPLKPTSSFSGRSTHLLDVCEALKSPSKTLVVTAGTGGVGKTEFARKVAQEVFDFFEGRVFWMDSETQESLQKCLLDLSTYLKIPHGSKSKTSIMSMEEMKKLFKAIYSHFSTSNQNSLFIFDNANQFKPTSSPTANESIFLVSDFLPNSFPPETFSPCPAILITSRSSDWDESKDFQLVNLKNFDLEETLEYFKNSFPETPEEKLKECEPEIKELHRRFDGYTLAFTLAAGWIRGAGHSRNVKEGLKCYLQFFQRPSNNLHKKDESSSSSDNNYKFDPHEIMEQTCSAIDEENPLALKLLKQMSFLSTDFLTVPDCEDLNQNSDIEQIGSALNTLLRFNVIKIMLNESFLRTAARELAERGSGDHIDIHRVIQQLVKESQTKSKDVSILFEMCETLVEQEQVTTVSHLKSVVSNLQEFRATLSFWFFSKKPKCDGFIKQLRLKIKNLKLNDDMTLRAIHMKLRNVKPPIDVESVMDNSDCLDESNQLYKITYQELANFVLLKSMEEKLPELYPAYSVAVLNQLKSLEIWPQFSLDKLLSWLTSRRRRHHMEHELDIITICLKNPHTSSTPDQRQELEHIQMEFQPNAETCFETKENAQNWLNILQHEMFNGRPFPLTDNDKIKIMSLGIRAAVFSTTLDDHKYSQFLNILRENKTEGDRFGFTLAQRLFCYMPYFVYSYKAPTNTAWIWYLQRFTEILLLLFNLAQPFSSNCLDYVLSDFKPENKEFEKSMNSKRLCCRFAMMISMLSVSKSEEFVSQIDSYFKRLFEISKTKHFKDIKTNCQPRDREIVKGFLPYLNSFVEQNQDSKDENAKELVNVVQSLIFEFRVY